VASIELTVPYTDLYVKGRNAFAHAGSVHILRCTSRAFSGETALASHYGIERVSKNLSVAEKAKKPCGKTPKLFLEILAGSKEQLRRSPPKRKNCSTALRPLQKIGPVLHHLGAWLQVKGMIIGRAYCVARSMGKLQFNVFMPMALFVQDGGRQPAKAENRSGLESAVPC
jgi:hypothetical protein